MATATAARAEGNYKLLLQAVSQGTRLINMMMKTGAALGRPAGLRHSHFPPMGRPAGKFSARRPRYHDRLPGCPGRNLVHPCPAAPPPSPAPAYPEHPAHAALQNDVSISAPPKAIDENRKPKTKNRLPEKWEKSGNSAGNDCYILDEEEQYRIV